MVDEFNQKHAMTPLSQLGSLVNLSDTLDSTYNWTKDVNKINQRSSKTATNVNSNTVTNTTTASENIDEIYKAYMVASPHK